MYCARYASKDRFSPKFQTFSWTVSAIWTDDICMIAFFLMFNHWCDQFLSPQNAQSYQTHHKNLVCVQRKLIVPYRLLYFCMENIFANTNQRKVCEIAQNAALS